MNVRQVLLNFEWTDPRVQWLTATGIGNWRFPSRVSQPIDDVWVPKFRLTNCRSKRCRVKPEGMNLPLVLNNDGSVEYESELLLTSTCSLDLKCTTSVQSRI